MNDTRTGKRFGLVLSGGGARGLAQVGVLKALEEEGIRPDFIVGVSIGSIIGGLYAAGYSATRLEKAVRDLNWKELLQLSDAADRRILTIDQKSMADRSILTVHLDGLQPVLPTAASNGQRLMNALNTLVIQSLYHSTNFDSLAIPFRAVATDLHSGQRVVLRHGNLAEALRASSAIPVMYSPVARDGMLLVDGGLVSNVPVDVAREAGCDIVVAVNTTSPLRTPEQLSNVLETLDQVFNVMMTKQAENLCRLADMVIEPGLGSTAATDFSNPDSLVAIGYIEGKRTARALKALLAARTSSANPMSAYSDLRSTQLSDPASQSYASTLRTSGSAEGDPSDVSVAEEDTTAGTAATRGGSIANATVTRAISTIRLHGVSALTEAGIAGIESRWLRQPFHQENLRSLREYILEEYRLRGYSLAYIREMDADPESGSIRIVIEEGRIRDIRVEGNERTDAVVILREIPLKAGAIFRIGDIEQGMNNLAALPLFHNVTFDVEDVEGDPVLIIRVQERTSQMLQVGVLVDNERNAQLGVLLRDASFLGSGTELRGSFFSGARNRRFAAEYHTNRMFYTPFSFTAEGYYGFRDHNEYGDVEGLSRSRFEREVQSVYRAIGYGAQASLGMYAGRFGILNGRLRYEQQSIRTTEFRKKDAGDLAENHLVVSVGFSVTLDTQDRYPFPDEGVHFQGEYQSAQRFLGGEVAFSRIDARYEFYLPLIEDVIVLHPRLQFGYGDKTMPRYEEFRIGGLFSFIGMRENEFNGRQIAVGGIELRYRLPFDILFDSYLSLRYDIGRTWSNPELIRISELRQGAGFVLGLDTPIGPALFGVGKSFLPVKNNPETSVKIGPTNLYFSIGVPLE
ncbi:MAG: patatin-like phospholipase family protein [Bacteroidia bacterium]|nr:patatin-like phospholipase family protein [Bacteroidia bacterium]